MMNHSGYYTMLLIRYIALVLLVATVTAECSSSSNTAKSTKLSWESNLCTVLLCVIKSVVSNGGQFDMVAIFSCFSTLQPFGEGDSIRFTVMNSANDTDTRGTIANAALGWGKWTVDSVDVGTVSGTNFDSQTSATFTARGRQNSPSGTEGSFEIHEADKEGAVSKKVASVLFSASVWGDNRATLKVVPNSGYVCTSPGLENLGRNTSSPAGVGTLKASVMVITCHKLNFVE